MLSSMDTYLTMIIIITFMYSKTIFFKKIKKPNDRFLRKSCKILYTNVRAENHVCMLQVVQVVSPICVVLRSSCCMRRAYIYPCTRIVSVLVITNTYHLLYIMLSVDYILFYNIKVYL